MSDATIVGSRVVTGGETAVQFVCGGSRWRTVGRELYGAFPVFRAALDAVCDALEPALPLPLVAVVFAPRDGVDAQLLEDPAYSQPASFAFEVALARLWQSWGVRFGAVAGRDAGESAAAHIAGLLSLDDAARLVAARGQLVGRSHGGPATEQFAEIARGCRFEAPALALYSSSTGEWAGPALPPGAGMRSAAYWIRQATEPAAFPDVLDDAGHGPVLECGPMGVQDALRPVKADVPLEATYRALSPPGPNQPPLLHQLEWSGRRQSLERDAMG